jgi:hypothetical protein
MLDSLAIAGALLYRHRLTRAAIRGLPTKDL